MQPLERHDASGAFPLAAQLHQPGHEVIARCERTLHKAMRDRRLFQVEQLDAARLDGVRDLLPITMANARDVMTAARALDPRGVVHYEQVLSPWSDPLAVGDGAALYFLARAETWKNAEALREAMRCWDGKRRVGRGCSRLSAVEASSSRGSLDLDHHDSSGD